MRQREHGERKFPFWDQVCRFGSAIGTQASNVAQSSLHSVIIVLRSSEPQAKWYIMESVDRFLRKSVSSLCRELALTILMLAPRDPRMLE